MGLNFAQGKYVVEHTEKYVGNGNPRYRSSWECQAMRFFDHDPRILKWASEAVAIPYKNPFTGKMTTYIPDFFIQYIDKNGKLHSEIIEIKPLNQTVLEKVGKNKVNQYQYAKNMVKWAAAREYCSRKGLTFRIISENQLFHTGKN